jgi:hypothetical protein
MDNPLNLGLTQEEISGITGFLGYGNPKNSVWFIGLEEGWGKCSECEARENLKPRSRFEPVMDLFEAHLTLKEDHAAIDIEAKKSFTPVWVYKAKLMLGIAGIKDWSDNKSNRKVILKDAKNYIRFKLGRRDGDTFLTELSPIPTKRTADLNWMDAFCRADSRLIEKTESRTKKLMRLLEESKPSRVICYGKRADEFGALLGVQWHSINAQGRILSSSDGRCLLLPFFGNGQMSHSDIQTLVQDGLL